MKRIALVAVVLVLVAAVALPPLFGARARSLIEAEVTGIADALAPFATVTVVFDDWDVDWFSSTASVSLGFELAAESAIPVGFEDQPRQFELTLPELVTVHHGPVVTTPSMGFGWGGVEFVVDAALVPALQDFQDAIGVDHVARLGILISFFGGTNLGIDMPAFAYEDDETRIDFQGLAAHAAFDADVERMHFDGEVGGLNVAALGSPSVILGRLDVTGNSRASPRFPGLWLGGGRLDMERISGSDTMGNTYELSDLRMEGASDIDGNVYVATGTYEVGELHVMGVRLTDIAMELAMRVGAEAMALLMSAGYDADDLSAEAQADLLIALVTERLTFNIDRLSLRHEERSASAMLAAEYRGDELPDDISVDDLGTDFATLLPLASATLELAFHTDLVAGLGLEQVDAWVRVLAREGIVLESGDEYTLNVAFEGGALTVNGEPFEVYDLFRLAGGI